MTKEYGSADTTPATTLVRNPSLTIWTLVHTQYIVWGEGGGHRMYKEKQGQTIQQFLGPLYL
jgi:hypothetical protein